MRLPGLPQDKPRGHAAKQVPPNFSKGSGGTEALTYLVRVASPHGGKAPSPVFP